MGLDAVRVILVRPHEAGNVGGAARALKNFGIGHLVLVDPRLPSPGRAFTRAHGAEDVYEGAEIVPDLAAALAPCRRAWGTTRRRGRRRNPVVSPREAARATASLAREGTPVAWVFGPEPTGLTSPELGLCSDRVVIPTSPNQPSLNLSHAVAVCLYETYLASQEQIDPTPSPVASLAERHALYAQLESGLLGIDFFGSAEAPAKMVALRGILERAALAPEEVRFLRGMARQIAWAGGHRAHAGKKDGQG